MTNDDFLAALGADWRRQTVDVTRVRRLTERRRQWARLAMLARLAAAAVSLGFGLYYGWLVLARGAIVHAFPSVVLLIGAPLILLEYASARRHLSIDHGDTPAGVLRQARQQAALSRHLLWGCRAAAILLVIAAAGVLALDAAGRAAGTRVGVAVPLWLSTALAAWLWQAWKARRYAAEIARCDSMLAELGAAEGG